MGRQLDLFREEIDRPKRRRPRPAGANVIDAMPALIRKAARETICQKPPPKGGGSVTDMRRTA